MKKVLVAYATAAGSTAEIAEVIGAELRTVGHKVDVVRCKKVDTVAGYDGIVIGSGVRAHKTYAEANRFGQANAKALLETPVALFVSCGAMKEGSDEGTARAQGYADGLAAQVPGLSPVSVGLFPGAVDFDRMSWLFKMILKKGFNETGGDYRDWDFIRGWAEELGAAFESA